MKPFRRLILAAAAVGVAAGPLTAQSYPGAAAAMPGFGNAVAVAGDQVLVGEPENRLRPGLVYVYEREGGRWVETGRLSAPDGAPGDGFGSALAADGETLLVGAADAVHVFRRSGGSWRHGGRLTATDVADEDGFAAALALSGDVALVGAPGQSDETGAAYVFRRSGGSWSQVGKLRGAAAGAGFGEALAVRGDMALVGAPDEDGRTGAVYLYQVDAAGAPTRVARLQPEGLGQNQRLGASVAFFGDRVLAGAPLHASRIGSVFVFGREDDRWQTVGQLLPFDVPGRSAFGTALAAANGQVWVGAPSAGAAYLFWSHGQDWGGVARVSPGQGARSDFGASLAFAGGEVVAFGLPGADFRAGQAAVYTRGPQGDWTEASRVMSEVENLAAVTGEEVVCGEDGEAAHFDCSEVDLLSFVPVEQMGADRGVRVNDVWGWVDSRTGKEWALVGMTNQAVFVDITDPNNPIYAGRLPMTEGANPNVWRDIKVYQDHAFIVADGAGQHGMQVFDLTRLREFDGEPITFDVDAYYDRIASAHNIVVNTETGFAYAVGASSGGETCGGGLHMIDVRDPENPRFAGCFADPQTGRSSTGYSHDAMCIVYHGPDADYQGREICVGANETAISIADVTDKDAPVALSRASYPNYGYSHQGWIDDEHRYFYLDDELDELQGNAPRTRTLIWDLADLEDPQLVGEFMGTTEASDHNLYVKGNVMYQSNYQAGLRIVDITNRENPREVGFFDTVPYGENTAGFGGSWSNYPYFPSGNVIVTSGNEGLFIVKPRTTNTIS